MQPRTLRNEMQRTQGHPTLLERVANPLAGGLRLGAHHYLYANTTPVRPHAAARRQRYLIQGF